MIESMNLAYPYGKFLSMNLAYQEYMVNLREKGWGYWDCCGDQGMVRLGLLRWLGWVAGWWACWYG